VIPARVASVAIDDVNSEVADSEVGNDDALDACVDDEAGKGGCEPPG
jgi:hypothetical protein